MRSLEGERRFRFLSVFRLVERERRSKTLCKLTCINSAGMHNHNAYLCMFAFMIESVVEVARIDSFTIKTLMLTFLSHT